MVVLVSVNMGLWVEDEVDVEVEVAVIERVVDELREEKVCAKFPKVGAVAVTARRAEMSAATSFSGVLSAGLPEAADNAAKASDAEGAPFGNKSVKSRVS